MRYRDEDLRHATSRRGCCLSRLLTFLLLLVILAYPFLEPFLLETETVFLTSDALSKDIGQLRIVYLSDIHEGSFYSHGRVQELATKHQRPERRPGAAGRPITPRTAIPPSRFSSTCRRSAAATACTACWATMTAQCRRAT